MKYEKYRRKIINNVKVIENDNIDNRIHFSDFVALFIAFFQVMAPILIFFFIAFLIVVFLLVKFWLR